MQRRSILLSLITPLSLCLAVQYGVTATRTKIQCNVAVAKEQHTDSLRSTSAISADFLDEEDAFAPHSSFRQLEGDGEYNEDDRDRKEDGNDIENHKPWGKVIGFTLLINFATLSGVLFLIPAVSRGGFRAACWNEAIPEPEEARPSRSSHVFNIFIPSFAAGALLATGIFLVIPEAVYHIQKSLDEEEKGGKILPSTAWRFGTAFLAGFIIPIALNIFLPKPTTKLDSYEGDANTCDDELDLQQGQGHNNENEEVIQQVEDPENDEKKRNTGEARTHHIDYSLAVSILIGDAFHNFCDGVFVGVGFMLCDLATAYTIFGITLYHEIAQEIADYFILTKHVGFSPIIALVLNFISGLSVLLGGLVVLATPVSDMLIGVVLSVTTGVYTYIAASECLPRVIEVTETKVDSMWTILFFIIGVVPIGLVLLNHSFCKA